MDDPPVAIRLLQHPIKIIVGIPGILLPYTAYPPIVSNVDRRLTDGAGASPPRPSPIKQGKVIDDIFYAVCNLQFQLFLDFSDSRPRLLPQIL
jgi:hypothetical protein